MKLLSVLRCLLELLLKLTSIIQRFRFRPRGREMMMMMMMMMKKEEKGAERKHNNR